MNIFNLWLHKLLNLFYILAHAEITLIHYSRPSMNNSFFAECYSRLLRILSAGAGSRDQAVSQTILAKWLACDVDCVVDVCSACCLATDDGKLVILARPKFQDPVRVSVTLFCVCYSELNKRTTLSRDLMFSFKHNLSAESYGRRKPAPEVEDSKRVTLR